jgi:hypothetical protein
MTNRTESPGIAEREPWLMLSVAPPVRLEPATPRASVQRIDLSERPIKSPGPITSSAADTVCQPITAESGLLHNVNSA